MHFVSIVALVTVIPVVAALRCHRVTTTSIDQPITSVAQDCPISSMSCLKTVDMQFRTYTKDCSYTNCTNQQNLPANPGCYNFTNGLREQYNCCCYGDGCNPASQTSFLVAGLSMMVAFFF